MAYIWSSGEHYRSTKNVSIQITYKDILFIIKQQLAINLKINSLPVLTKYLNYHQFRRHWHDIPTQCLSIFSFPYSLAPYQSPSPPHNFLTSQSLRLPFGRQHLTRTGSWWLRFIYINAFLLIFMSTLFSTAKYSYWCIYVIKNDSLSILNTTSNYIWTSYIVFQLNYVEWHINASVISDTHFFSYFPYNISFLTRDVALYYSILDSEL
jgi:hypothetical protein